jgi:hypothetical protein
MICVPEIVVILITVVNIMKSIAKIITNVQQTLVLVKKDAYITILSVTMKMSVPSILVVKKVDANIHLPVVTIITHVPMILAILLLVV